MALRVGRAAVWKTPTDGASITAIPGSTIPHLDSPDEKGVLINTNGSVGHLLLVHVAVTS